jgi:hypothetical protein
MTSVQPLVTVQESPEHVCDGIDLNQAQLTARRELHQMLSADRATFDFLRGRICGEESNPGIAGIYCLLRSRGKQYLVMEFLAGENGGECARRSPASFEQATPILNWLCQGTGKAEPARSRSVSRSQAEVVDIGFARIATNPEKPLHGVVVVTPEYVAPGLMLGPGSNDPGVACSSAITLYELLCCKAGSESSVEGANQVVTLCRLGSGEPLHTVPSPAATGRPRFSQIVSALLRNRLKVRIALGSKARAAQPDATDNLFVMTFPEQQRQAV